MPLTYDRVSPGHVLSVCEESIAPLLAQHCGWRERDLDREDDLLYRGMVHLNGNIGGTVRQDLGAIRIYEFNTPCAPDLDPILGRCRIGDFSFLGVLLVPRHEHALYAVLYVANGEPKAYVPRQGNAVTATGALIPDTQYGEVLYAYDRARIEADLRATFIVP